MMKQLLPTLCSFAFGLLILTGCQQSDAVLPLDHGMSDLATCDQVGVIKDGPCGMYIHLDNGRQVFSSHYRGVVLEPGAKIEMAYRNVTRSTAQSSNQGGCGGDNSSSNSHEQCMANEGISQVSISCINILEPAPPANDEDPSSN